MNSNRSSAIRSRDLSRLLDVIPLLYANKGAEFIDFNCGPTLRGVPPTPRWSANEVEWSQSVVDVVFAAINGSNAVSLNSLKLQTGEVDCPAERRIPHQLASDRYQELSRIGPRLVHTDPFYNRAQNMLPTTDVLIDSDYHTRGQLESSAAFAEYYRPFGSRFQLSMVVPSYLAGEVAFVCVMRWANAFTERERSLAKLLQEHICRAHRMRQTPRRFNLEERDPSCLQSLGLTPRQTEVLYWLACGKRDGEIGCILGASMRTITTHVEAIYRRLGVENRISAARLVMETL